MQTKSKIELKPNSIAEQKPKRQSVLAIEILEEIDRHKVHYEFSCRSLFEYTTKIHGLSAEVAYIFINVARKARQFPGLKEEIKNGNITVSKARRISSVLTRENQNHWLELARTASKHELEKQVAAASPREAVREKMSYVSGGDEIKEKISLLTLPEIGHDARMGMGYFGQSDTGTRTTVRVQLQVGISEELMLKIRRVQDLVSGKKKRLAGLEEALSEMAESYLDK